MSDRAESDQVSRIISLRPVLEPGVLVVLHDSAIRLGHLGRDGISECCNTATPSPQVEKEAINRLAGFRNVHGGRRGPGGVGRICTHGHGKDERDQERQTQQTSRLPVSSDPPPQIFRDSH